MSAAPPIPARCARRPTNSAGLVIPYVSVVAAASTDHGRDILLGEVHGARAARCIRVGLCQVCAQPLERPFVVLTTARRLTEQWSSEAPLHPECARYSRLACPMLAGKMPTYRQRGQANGRPCPDPDCDCGGWVDSNPGAVSKGGQPAEAWFEVWLNDYAIAIFPNRTINGVSWRGITPLKVRALPRPDPPPLQDADLLHRLAAALAAPIPADTAEGTDV